MTWFAIPALGAAAYYMLALMAAWRVRRHPERKPQALPAISILKPVHGRDPDFYEAIRSHALQNYPDFEILFGASTPDDEALADIERLQAEVPERRIRVLVAHCLPPNRKVGVLAELSREARHPVLLVNDSDIVVEPGYLANVAAHLEDPGVGLVTCLYRARASSWASRWEALGIATEFTPSVLVARMLGVVEFALGSTMAFRAADLKRIGGFERLGDYLADDYQLGKHLAGAGMKIVFAEKVVETNLGAGSWGQVWRHQLRWARTIRVSRPGGYYGYMVTHATLWCLVAWLGGAWPVAAVTMALRLAAGALTSVRVLGDRRGWRDLWLMPLRDMLGFATWLAGIRGDIIEWRGERMRLTREGKMEIAGNITARSKP